MRNIYLSVLLTFLLACIIDPAITFAGNGQIMFVAKLNCDNEVPVVRGDALGLVTFLLSEDRKEILIHGVFTNLTGPVIGCHIHQAPVGQNGPVLVDLTSYVAGVRIKASLPLPAGILQLAQNGELYINVHTASHPTGEIRGQLVMMTETIIPVYASGLQQVPPDTNGGFGLGTLHFSPDFKKVHYELLPVGLTGPVTAAHIHNGQSGQNGNVLVALNTGEFITGTIEDTAIVNQVLSMVLFGTGYINLHTALNPNGEIRAQLEWDPVRIDGKAILNGDQENPPVTTTATAYGYAAINPTMDSITYTVVYSGITPISAHIHNAPFGTNGPVILGLQSIAPGIYSAKSLIGENDITSFLKDELYFNIHSANHPGGEIRGQIISSLMNSFAFDLCGDQEVPVKTVNAYGAAYVAINKSNTELDYGMITDKLNGDATSTRFYDGAFGSIGTTLLNLDLPNPFVSKVIPTTATIVSKIEADHVYLNIHNAANPTGEIRGQIRRSLSCRINTSVDEYEPGEISLHQNLSHNDLYLVTDFDRILNFEIIISDISGKQILQSKATISPGDNKTAININKLSPGFYLLNLLEDNKSVAAFKFVVAEK
jgi:hypothetical protein